MERVEFDEAVRKKISRWPKSKTFRQGAITYAERLSEAGFPVIFEFNHLAHHLHIRRRVLADMVNRTEGFYHEFSIPKRRGGQRTIAVPSPSHLHAQKWILENILERIKLHPDAFGFRRNFSIIDNARKHLCKTCLLKMDIEDFSHSINIKRIIPIFSRVGYAPNVCYYLACLCCHRERLPQGAATSPYLSNIIAKRLDARIAGFCKPNEWSYSRYADDIAISGECISGNVIVVLEKIMASEGFRANHQKTILVKGNRKKIVTGLSVVGKSLRIPRDYKRNIKKEIYFVRKFGVESHCERIEKRDVVYLDRLEGKVRFWLHVEPENESALKSLGVIMGENEKLRNEIMR